MFFPYISTYILVILFPLMGRYPFHTLFLPLRYSVSQFLNYKLTTRLVENIGFSHPNLLFVLLELTFVNFLLFYQNPPQPRINRTSKYLGIIIGLLHLERIPSVSIAASSPTSLPFANNLFPYPCWVFCFPIFSLLLLTLSLCWSTSSFNFLVWLLCHLIFLNQIFLLLLFSLFHGLLIIFLFSIFIFIFTFSMCFSCFIIFTLSTAINRPFL